MHARAQEDNMCVLIKQIKTQYKTCSALLILSRRWLHDTLDSFIESSLLLKIQSQLNLNIILTPKSTTATQILHGFLTSNSPKSIQDFHSPIQKPPPTQEYNKTHLHQDPILLQKQPILETKIFISVNECN